MLSLTTISLLIAAVPLDEDPAGPCYERLVPMQPGPQRTVECAMSGDVLVAGGEFSDYVAISTRAADGTWAQTQVLNAPAGPNEEFGRYVDVEGDWIAVCEGGPFSQSSGGAVHMYERDATSGNFAPTQILTIAQPQLFGRYGHLATFAGNQLLVLSLLPTRVDVYDLDTSGTWVLGSSVPWPGGNGSQAKDIAAFGDWFAITETASFFTAPGQASFFRRDAITGDWGFHSVLIGVDQATWGLSIAMSEDRLLAGAPSYLVDRGGLFQYSYDSVTDTWGDETEIEIPYLESGDEGGVDVDIDGDVGVVGVPLDSELGLETGAAWMLDRNAATGDWSIGRRLRSRRTNNRDEFGHRVAVSDGRIAVAGFRVPPTGTAWHIFEPALDLDGNSWADLAEVGRNICLPNAINDSKASGTLAAVGSQNVSANDLVLIAENLPRSTFGYVVSGDGEGLIVQPGGSRGDLCIQPSPFLGRFTDQVQPSGGSGTFTTQVDLTAIPTSQGGAIALMPGDVWYFQVWYRDGASSNFTNATYVGFL